MPSAAGFVWHGDDGAGDARPVGEDDDVVVGITAPGVEMMVCVIVCVAPAAFCLLSGFC